MKQIASKNGEHIDLENSHSRDGQIHYQDNEESLSGLTISLSSPVITAAEGVRSTIRTAQTRDNKTLQALEAYEGGKTLNDQIHAMKQGGIGSVGIHVGIGSSSFKHTVRNHRVCA